MEEIRSDLGENWNEGEGTLEILDCYRYVYPVDQPIVKSTGHTIMVKNQVPLRNSEKNSGPAYSVDRALYFDDRRHKNLIKCSSQLIHLQNWQTSVRGRLGLVPGLPGTQSKLRYN